MTAPILAIDPGSRHTGAAVLSSSLPVAILRATTIDVDAANLAPTVAAIVALAAEYGCGRIIVEHARWHAPDGDKGKIMATQATWLVTHDLVRDLQRALPHLELIARQTWAHRIKPHTRGAITDAMVTEALRALLGSEADKLTDVHQRDAAGAGLGALLAPVKTPRVRKAKAPPTEERRAAQRLAMRKPGWKDRPEWQGKRGRNAADDAFDRLLAERQARGLS